MKNMLLLFGFCFLGCILGLGFFMNGLLSTSSSKLPSVSDHDLLKDCHPIVNDEICYFLKNMSQTHYYNHNQKIVIILIDALRADFIPFIKYNDKFNLSMPYTEMLLKSRSALSFITKGFAPTVTLPRIKTLLTGTVSNFIDILLNFNAFELDNDNILKQASSNGLKSVFYGDDTWLKMFPNLFIRSEGTHSFFVSDFKEVDLNVSRHIEYEIKRMDWNLLILHFLGVDHIGHSHGPFSEHLLPKLIEMDDVIKFMYEKLKTLSNSSLIILCGDHGMTISGSHGGITQDELLTPLVFIRTSDSHHVEFNFDSETVLDQIDFAPTFSTILGISIPSNSYGQIIFDALKFVGFSKEEILYAAYINLLQICKVYESIFPLKTGHLSFFKETVENHYKWFKDQTNENSDYIYILNSYERLLHNMKNDLLSVISGYDDFSMILGILIMWISVIFSFYTLFTASYNNGRNLKNVCPYKMTLILSIALPVIIFSYVYLSNFVKLFILFLSVCFIFLIYQTYFLLYVYFCDQKTGPLTGKVMVYFLIIHALSLFSSSFIEEEHQTWYYLACSLPMLICLKKSVLFFTQKTNTENMCKKSFWNDNSLLFVVSLTILILHRIFRKWNQAGNKWLHMPDITDWLNLEKHIIYLGILTIIAQFVLALYFKNKLDKLNYMMFNLGLILISIQKLDDLVFSSFLEHYTKSVLIPWTIYLLSAFITVSSLLLIYRNSAMISEKVERFTFDFISAWILLVEIIGRIHNIPLIVNVIVQEYLLNRITWRENFDITTNVISYFIMAMTSFFYHGNSNSLSTIDVFAGYTGVQSYKPVFVGFLIICNTYSTFLMWLMLLFCRITHAIGDLKGSETKIMYTFLYLLDYKLIILSIYCTVMFLMRHHLFIFSVFFPKLFYEVSHVLIVTIIFIFVCFVSSILFSS